MEVVIVICLVLMLALIIGFFVKMAVLSREDRLENLKKYKKGRFALIYLIAIPLYTVGIHYGGTPIGFALVNSIKSCVNLIILKFDYENIEALLTASKLFRVTIYIYFSLVVVNAFLFAASLVGRAVVNAFRVAKAKWLSKRVNIVIGYNEHSKMILKSIDKKKETAVLFASKKDESALESCWLEKIAFVSFNGKADVGEKIFKMFKHFDKKSINVIINTEKDDQNLILVKQLCDLIQKLKLAKTSTDDSTGLAVNVFGQPQNLSAFVHFEEKSKGCIKYVNQYQLVAMDFVDKYPITEYMNEEHIDYSSATVKDDLDVNVVMVGFGKTSEELLLVSVANNQLITKKDGKVVDKPINYFVYDKKQADNDKNLNHNYFRYSKEIDKSVSDGKYLPFPNDPANLNFFPLDINSINFYDGIKDKLQEKEGRRAYNYLIVSIGEDMENFDMAEKLSSKVKEWGMSGYTKVFVKIRDKRLADEVFEKEYITAENAANPPFIVFGIESDVVYNVDRIVREKQAVMARNRNLCYDLIKGKKESESLTAWYALAEVQRLSNVYASLSIRLKLQLLGFDYEKTDGKDPDASKEYYALYEDGNPINYDETNVIKGKKVIKYTEGDYIPGKVRTNLVEQEHQRWNAYMITRGFVPSTIDQIKAGSVKDFGERRHANLTTMDGLVEFRNIVPRKPEQTPFDKDVIQYDYQLMDDIAWLLAQNDYKIVKREKAKTETEEK